MNLTTEQIKRILANAPDEATHYDTYCDEYLNYDVDQAYTEVGWVNVCIDAYADPSRLSDLRKILALRKRVQELEAQVQNYPMQPIVKDEHGTFRFEENPVINWLATEVSDMNQIAIWAAKNNVPNKYKEQLAQMVGYSVSGYGTLSYVSDENYERAVNSLPPETKEKDDD